MKRRQLSMFDPVSIDSYFEYWIIWRFEFWCNALVEGWTHGLQGDIGTSGRNEDDHALLSGWLGNDALFAGWYSSQCAVTRGWSRWTGCSSLYEYHIGRQAAASLSRCCSVEKVDVLAVVRGTADCELLEVDIWPIVRGTGDGGLLVAFRHIFCVKKPVDILRVVQGTVSCRLLAAIPSCCCVKSF